MQPKRGQSTTVASAYDSGSAAYLQAWRQPHPWMEEARRQFASRVSPGMTLLDVGCGPGHDSRFWADKGLKTLGIDVSPKTIAGARALYKGLSFEVLDVLDLPTLGRTFDAVWMAYSLLHIAAADAPKALAVIAGALKPGGPLFIETPTAEKSAETVRPIAGLKDEAGREIEVPYTLWSESDLLKMLAGDFKLEWGQTASPLPGRPNSWSGILRRR